MRRFRAGQQSIRKACLLPSTGNARTAPVDHVRLLHVQTVLRRLLFRRPVGLLRRALGQTGAYSRDEPLRLHTSLSIPTEPAL